MRAPNHPTADVRMTYKPADLGCGFSVPSEECEQNPWQLFPLGNTVSPASQKPWVGELCPECAQVRRDWAPSTTIIAQTSLQQPPHSHCESHCWRPAQSLPGFLRGGAGPPSGNIRLDQFSLCDQVDQSSAVTLRHKYMSFMCKVKL